MVGTRWIAVLVMVLGFALPSQAQDMIRWESDLQQAADTARQQGKLLLIHFYNDGCPPCERLEKNVFNQATVAISISKGYVPVKVHAGKSPKVAESFQVDRWPVDIIATPSGEELFRTVSPQAVNSYVTMLEEVSKKAAARMAMQANAVAAATAPMTPAANTPPATAPAAAGGAGYIVNQYAPAANPAEIVNRYSSGISNAGKQMQAQAGQSVQSMQGAAVAASQRGMDQVNQAGNAAMQAAQQKVDAGMAYGQQVADRATTAVEQGANQAVAQGQKYVDQGMSTAGQYAQQAQKQASVYGGQVANQVSQYMPSAPAVTQPQASMYGDPAAAHSPENVAPPANAVAQDQPWNPAENAPPAGAQNSVYGSYASNKPMIDNPSAGMPDITAPANPQPAGMKFVSASQAPSFGLEKYCPVTMAESMKWAKGNPQFGAVHRGRTYLFASQEAQQKFLADPDRFSPVLSGCDPVVFVEQGKLVDGSRNCGLTYRGQMFFFVNKANADRFWKSPDSYTVPSYQAMMQADTRTR
ncbi:MAG: thioredoxin family protein [Planctomycetaceae bacterium]